MRRLCPFKQNKLVCVTECELYDTKAEMCTFKLLTKTTNDFISILQTYISTALKIKSAGD
jgi:hypothetical protein